MTTPDPNKRKWVTVKELEEELRKIPGMSEAIDRAHRRARFRRRLSPVINTGALIVVATAIGLILFGLANALIH